MNNEIFVISVGGSLIYPEKLDVDFLIHFKEIILKHVEKGTRFVLITGGGRISRNYQAAARELGDLDNEDLDWLGIHGTRINAHLLRIIFKEHANPKVINDPNEKIDFNEKILVAAGWKPGNSTDYVAVLLAKQLGVKKLINLSNIDYVYDKDPSKHVDAKPFKEMKWVDFRRLVGDEWDPGLSTPFDPVASKEAEKLGLTVYILDGDKLKNIDNLLEGKEFVGTIIE
ncbi:hypothetical protein AYK26_07220 [Euryarchaeota archaeon SM23-78]|nr:MAG: hypothetical protein AYK26_07220 [Euryarchaeota archaeon SM23-78]MBW3001031.1 UMP kinase [Candidatus Woesearchaeota archaeon]